MPWRPVLVFSVCVCVCACILRFPYLLVETMFRVRLELCQLVHKLPGTACLHIPRYCWDWRHTVPWLAPLFHTQVLGIWTHGMSHLWLSSLPSPPLIFVFWLTRGYEMPWVPSEETPGSSTKDGEMNLNVFHYTHVWNSQEQRKIALIKELDGKKGNKINTGLLILASWALPPPPT